MTKNDGKLSLISLPDVWLYWLLSIALTTLWPRTHRSEKIDVRARFVLVIALVIRCVPDTVLLLRRKREKAKIEDPYDWYDRKWWSKK